MSCTKTSGQLRFSKLMIRLFVVSILIFHNEVLSAQTLVSASYQSRYSIFASISDPTYQGMRRFSEHNPLFNHKIPGLKKTIEFETETNTVTIQQKLLDTDFKLPVTLSFDEYLDMRYKTGTRGLWLGYVNKSLFSEIRQNQGSGKGIGFDIPIPIKSQTFAKIFGGNTVGLSVTGNVSINGGLRHEKRSQVKTAINRPSNTNFKMKQTQKFIVKGNVGQKVNVYVNQDSERAFEFDNAIRLEYKGFEDEIIESIEAGNVALNLPGSRFVTFSAKNSGLFGIKTNMRLGNLKMTAIASQEKGQKKKLSISGGATSDENKIDDYNYRAGTYFFLNTHYRHNFKRFIRGNHVQSIYPVSQIEVFKSEDRYYNQADAIFGWAIADTSGLEGSDPADPDTSMIDQNHYKGFFKRLEQNADYYVDIDLGFIALESPLRKGEVLAVAYRDSLVHFSAGDINYQQAASDSLPIILQLLRTDNPQPSDEVWDLEWKNVYYLGSRNINKEGFDLKIYFKPPSGDPEETIDIDGVPVSYLQIFGLDSLDLDGNPKPDNILDDNPNFINWARGELIFPELEPFKFERWQKKDKTFFDQKLANKVVDAIYDTTDHQYITKNSNFYVAVTAKVRQANYSLGFNIIEGSEEIILSGRILESGKDYIIDYFSGNLTILDEQATDPNASLEITYESNQLFQIDRKTILGTRWDYELFNNSFFGGTFLYLNQSTLDQKIRIGQDGPMQNFVWNLNTSLNFKPYFITRGLNALPLIQTKEETTVKFEAEVAQIIPNPNSRNNTATGDVNGVVYIDDFEAAKRESPLGILRRMWRESSVPKIIPGWDEYNFSGADVNKNQSRGRFIWYNPYGQVAIKEIWPERDVNTNVPQRVHVLTMRLIRDQVYGRRTWAGLMRYLSAGYADQTNSKFLEIWVRGNEGRLHIDFGQISEDAIPNGRLNTEDRDVGGIRNGLLDDGEDVGLDGVAGKDGNNVPGDLGNDDWAYSSGSSNYEHINGTEGNLNDEGGRFPDTEDMNQNGSIDLRNDYFEYSFNLDKTHPDAELIAGGLGAQNDFGWRMYRIPLADPDTVIGNPQWANIEYVRIWMDEAPRDTIWAHIAEINLVGSEWKERGVAFADLDTTEYDAKNDTTVRVTVVNTYDNPDYIPPPGVAGETDQITKVIRREQALVLKISDLPPKANGIVQKSFFQPQSYVDYKVMKMFMYGLDPFNDHIMEDRDSSHIVLFFRFGADDRNYYEFRQQIFERWHKKNEMVISLEKLTGLKNIGELDKHGYLFGLTDDGDTLRVVGKPSLTNVRQLTVGVINNHPEDQPFTGEVWLNELRLTEVKKDKGMAMRARIDLKLADLVNVNAEISRIDDDFRTVNERFGKGNNQLRGSINASFKVEKFLPQSWGVSIPVNVGYQNSESSPKYFPGSDIVVSKETASDSLLETIKTISKRKTVSTSIKKTTRSRNPFIKYSLDGLSLNYSYSESFRSNSTIKEAKNFTYTGSFGYAVNFASKAAVKPFSWLGTKPFIKLLSGLSIHYLPKGLNYKFTFNRVKDNTLNRNGLVTPRYTFVVNQSFGSGIQPLKSLNFDYNYSRVNDLREVTRMSALFDDPAGIINGNLGPMTSMRQSFKFQLNPNLSTWLKINVTAGTNFSYSFNIQQKELGKSASNNITYGANMTLTPKVLFQKLSRKKPQPVQRRPRNTVPQRKEEEDEEKDPEKEEKKKRSITFINPLKLLVMLGEKIQPISFRYSQKSSSNKYGLKDFPPFAFQIGRTFNPGPVVQQNVGSNRGQFSHGYSLNSSSGLDVIKQIKITLKYDYDNNWNRTTKTTGSIRETRWRLGDKNIIFPNWTVRWSGLEKLPFINRYVQRANLDHGRTGQVVGKWQDRADSLISESTTASYRPLIGFSLTLKNSMNFKFQYNQSFSESINRRSGSSGTRKKTTDISASAGYSQKGGFTIPLPFFKNKKINNTIDFSMTFSKSSNVSEQKRGELGDYQEWTRNEKWTLQPRLTYSFSSTVRGGMHFEFGRTKNKVYGETRIMEFGINVNIQIAGR